MGNWQIRLLPAVIVCLAVPKRKLVHLSLPAAEAAPPAHPQDVFLTSQGWFYITTVILKL